MIKFIVMYGVAGAAAAYALWVLLYAVLDEAAVLVMALLVAALLVAGLYALYRNVQNHIEQTERRISALEKTVGELKRSLSEK